MEMLMTNKSTAGALHPELNRRNGVSCSSQQQSVMSKNSGRAKQGSITQKSHQPTAVCSCTGLACAHVPKASGVNGSVMGCVLTACSD